MNPPLVSVCVPTYNAERTLRETIDSILRQSYEHLDVLVCDNGSTDRTLEIARSFADPRVRVVTHERTVTAEGNFERCMRLAQGPLTAIFHADDLYEPDIIEREVRFMDRHPAAGAVFTGCLYINERGEGEALGLLPAQFQGQPEGVECDFARMFRLFLKHGNFVVCPSVMARTTIYQNEIATWDHDRYGSSADLDVWLRILQRHTMGFIPEPLVKYRHWAGSFSVSYHRLRTAEADYLRVLEAYVRRPDVQRLLTSEDRRNHARLRRRHDVVVANNALLKGDRALAGRIARRSTSTDAFAAVFRGGRDLRVLMALLAVWVGLRAPRLVRPVLEYVARRGG